MPKGCPGYPGKNLPHRLVIFFQQVSADNCSTSKMDICTLVWFDENGSASFTLDYCYTYTSAFVEFTNRERKKVYFKILQCILLINKELQEKTDFFIENCPIYIRMIDGAKILYRAGTSYLFPTN